MENEINEISKEELEEIDNLEDFDLEENLPTYEVWILCNKEDGSPAEFDYLVDDDYTDPVEGQKCFDYFNNLENLKEFISIKDIKLPEEADKVVLVLEKVIETDEETFTCTEVVKENSFEKSALQNL